MENQIKSGKEIVDEFFAGIKKLPNVDEGVSTLLLDLYEQEKLTDTSIKNGLQKIRDKNGAEN